MENGISLLPFVERTVGRMDGWTEGTPRDVRSDDE